MCCVFLNFKFNTAKSKEQIGAIISAVQRCGSLDYTRAQAQRYHDQALALLQHLPDNQWRGALERITHLSVHRDH